MVAEGELWCDRRGEIRVVRVVDAKLVVYVPVDPHPEAGSLLSAWSDEFEHLCVFVEESREP